MLQKNQLRKNNIASLFKHFETHPLQIALAGFVGAILFALILSPFLVNKNLPEIKKVIVTPTPKKEDPFGIYKIPKVAKRDYYTIFMVGDSMTDTLGPHGGKLSEFLNTLYQSTPGNQRIVIDNYAKGGKNILSLHDTLASFKSKKFQLILIESFGYNPLSQFPIEEGLEKQTKALDKSMKFLVKTHPDAVVVFVATIAPNKETYAQEASPGKRVEERVSQAEERMAYIKNHIEFAKAHKIPLVDIYTKSLTPEGNGNLLYINPNDHIHPSFAGFDFIGHEIANFIYESKLLPQ